MCSGPRYNLSSILCGVHSWPAEKKFINETISNTLCEKQNEKKKKGWLACIMPKSPKGNKEELMTMTEGIFPFLIHLLVFLPHLTLQRATSTAIARAAHNIKLCKQRKFSIFRPETKAISSTVECARHIFPLTANECQLTMAIWFIKLSLGFFSQQQQ